MIDEQDTPPELLELERLAVLEATSLLDTPSEETFDQFTRLASSILETPVALVSLVDQDRQFFKSSIGLPEPWASQQQTPLSHSFCKHVVHSSEPLSVADARTHPLLKHNKAILELSVIAYLGIPLTTAQGYTLGSFCVIDTKPRQWTARETAMLKDLAALVMEKIELRLFAKQLQADYLQLRSLELHRDEMVQMLVHNLRNPLTSFLCGLEMLRESKHQLKDLQQQYINVAYKGGETLLKMVNSILDVRKANSQELTLTLTKMSPGQIIESACQQMLPLAEKSKLKLTWHSAMDTPYQADAEKLCRVLINLVGNAIQHTPSGGTITVQERSDTDNTVQFSVIDTGRGIPSDAFEQVFQKYGQINSHQRVDASTGLGLPFSQMVVEAHGGRIWVESELGQGTIFHFTIPIVA